MRLNAEQRDGLKAFPAIVLRAEVERRRQQDAVLAAVSPDIAAEVRRQCAEEIEAEIRSGHPVSGLQRLLREWRGLTD